MNLRLLSLLSLAACASQGPTQYAQGVPVAPRAPAFTPTFDAPITVGQPGYVGPVENLPRSPYSRVLPETPETRKEPGIWAADKPRDDGPPGWKTRPPLILDVMLPLESDTDPAHEAAYHRQARACAIVADTTLRSLFEESELFSVTLDERACLAAMLYQHCVLRGGRKILESQARGVPVHEVVWIANRAMGASSSAFSKATCAKKGQTDWVMRVYGLASKKWDMFDWRM
jgi:hypothetical protein